MEPEGVPNHSADAKTGAGLDHSHSRNETMILGIPISDIRMDEAFALIEGMITEIPRRSHSIFFANAHTLNQLFEIPDYRTVLSSADIIFGDGIGVRLAARILHGSKLRDNINGTDLVPELFRACSGRGFRYFLLGNKPERIEKAAAFAKSAFPGWVQAGNHHGYLDASETERVIDLINASHSDLLLVGMGNPKQEEWIFAYRQYLDVPVCMGTGGLFDYWVGDLDRAPSWVRGINCEWVHLLLKQPRKANRYLLGNPKFLFRVFRQKILQTENTDYK